MKLPKKVTIVEVCPRDGFQAEAEFIPTARKIALIDALSKTGVSRIEATAFVHPRTVPQLADACEVMRGIERVKGVRYSALVPNLVGARRALECQVDEIDFVLSASESHNFNNVRKTIKESLKELESAANYSKQNNIGALNVYIATAFGCPFEGKISEQKVAAISEQLMNLGASTIILGDTTGTANPLAVERLLGVLGNNNLLPDGLAVHFHDTRGCGLANVLSALLYGVTTIEGSVGGLGGCPFAPGAAGNIATEDVINMLEEMGIDTGVDLIAIIDCAKLVEQIVGKTVPGQVMKAGRTCDLHQMPERT